MICPSQLSGFKERISVTSETPDLVSAALDRSFLEIVL